RQSPRTDRTAGFVSTDPAATTRIHRAGAAFVRPAAARRPRNGTGATQARLRTISGLGKRPRFVARLGAGAESVVHRVWPLAALRRSRDRRDAVPNWPAPLLASVPAKHAQRRRADHRAGHFS